MVAEAIAWVDVDSAVREWVRDSVPSVARRAFFGVNNAAPFPQVRVSFIAGTDEDALYQFDAWAQSRDQADLVAREIATAADALSRYVFGGVLLHGAAVEVRPRFVPDDEGDKRRSIVEVSFTATASS